MRSYFENPLNNLSALLILSLLLMLAATGDVWAHGMSEADKQMIADGGNMQYLWIGATHMLTGYDHLAFVFGIIFFLSSFRDVVKYVSAFTVGHSITLIYATFNAVQMNYYLIDAIIGLSVCYVAYANLDGFRRYLNINPPNMMVMILGLGLIHGLGLSTRLQELPLNPDQLLMNIISFNVGIELGQIAALSVMLLLIAFWRHRHSFKAFSLMVNYTLIAAGLFLFLMQMHDYSHSNQQEAVAADAAIPASISLGESVSGNEPVRDDTISIEIPGRGDIEYKVLMKRGAALDYSWRSDSASLRFDFHGDPKGDTTGYFKSYKKGDAASDQGSFQPPYEGRHGWYWKNLSNHAVHVELHIHGAYDLMDQSLHGKVAPPDPFENMEPDAGFMNLAPAPAN